MRTARKSLVTGRGAAIIGLIVIAVMLLAMPLREYLGQRSQMSAVAAQTAEHQARVDALANEAEQWRDPEYVRTKARSELHYVLPGEVGYIVLESSDADARKTGQADQANPSMSRPWFSALWRSVQSADR